MLTKVIVDKNKTEVNLNEYIGCRGFLIKDNKICIIHELNTGFYQIPGGALEKGESYRECCIREMQEETGFIVDASEPIIRLDELYEECKYISYYFMCNIKQEGERQLTDEEKENGAVVEWFDLDAAISIFATYKEYEISEPFKYGGFYREYVALEMLKKQLFDIFPYLENDFIIIRKMTENDVDALSAITDNDNVYRYIPPFLYKKSKGNLLAAIRNLGGRDFDKKKLIIAGIYLKTEPNHLIGLAEMFDYKKRPNSITIGYRLNESYWHKGIATNVIELMIGHLVKSIGINKLNAYVIPENMYSARALLKNGFYKLPEQVEEENWGGKDKVLVDVYMYENK